MRIGNGVKAQMTYSRTFLQLGAQLNDQRQHSTTPGSSKMPHKIPQQTSLVLKEDQEIRASTLSSSDPVSTSPLDVLTGSAFEWERVTNILLSSSWASNAELGTSTRIPQDKYYPI